ncbi:MAG: hypothetical protein QM730_04000 [Anaerolineales bacterium]
MTKTIQLAFFIILCVTLVSCSVAPVNSPPTMTVTVQPILASATPKLLVTITSIPSVTPSIPTPTPSRVPNLVCVESNGTASDGWDCRDETHGFTIHLPSTAQAAGTTNAVVDIWLENSPANPRIERFISIATGQNAEWCFTTEAETKQIGEHNFVIRDGYEPSGVVYAWKSYAIANRSKKVCFDFIVGFSTWEQDDPLFPPEEDQGLDEVEAILATFRWIEP